MLTEHESGGNINQHEFMSAGKCHQCGCPTPEVVEVPGSPGNPGSAGTAGTNGVNAFTFSTADFVIPACGSTVAVPVANLSWTVIGQIIFVSDGTNLAFFQVTALQASPPVVTLKALCYSGDSGAGVTVTSGATVVGGGVQGPAGTVVTATTNAATGGSQNLTAGALQALAVGLTLVGSVGKTYLLTCYVRLDYVAATLAANRIVTLTLQRTNNTPAALSSSTLMTEIIPSLDIQYYSSTTLTKSLGQLGVFSFPYTTVGVSDVIQPFVSISVIPSTGNINVVEAAIVAVRLT
jgi:hypothetical protein